MAAWVRHLPLLTYSVALCFVNPGSTAAFRITTAVAKLIISQVDMVSAGWLAGPWLQEFTELRDKLNTTKLDVSAIRKINEELEAEIAKTGRDHPIPKVSARAIARMEREAALAGTFASFDCSCTITITICVYIFVCACMRVRVCMCLLPGLPDALSDCLHWLEYPACCERYSNSWLRRKCRSVPNQHVHMQVQLQSKSGRMMPCSRFQQRS